MAMMLSIGQHIASTCGHICMSCLRVCCHCLVRRGCWHGRRCGCRGRSKQSYGYRPHLVCGVRARCAIVTAPSAIFLECDTLALWGSFTRPFACLQVCHFSGGLIKVYLTRFRIAYGIPRVVHPYVACYLRYSAGGVLEYSRFVLCGMNPGPATKLPNEGGRAAKHQLHVLHVRHIPF